MKLYAVHSIAKLSFCVNLETNRFEMEFELYSEHMIALFLYPERYNVSKNESLSVIYTVCNSFSGLAAPFFLDLDLHFSE
jgi:hypothetical protein